ncbi:exocyst complex component 3-like protein 4 isoform X2 [Cyclopterus lumpus]|uniref:exocyst complex component 3-like protein 4 isoform X2 n=1 Tax=Cyclopterus lumpus TaxID=8103 RepID=UPI0014874E91|nr:exocyst complex component 3-like protein 4 isoform X2 [Cyclopterus lumpus]
MEEDAVSLQSAGAALPAVLQTLRRSIRRAAEKSPLASGGKGSKVTAGDAPDTRPSASPNPNLARFGDSLLKRGASIRRSLKFSNKKDKACRQEAPDSVSEGPAEERKEQKAEKEEEEEEVEVEVETEEEMEEAYMLPVLPHTPLSVMQINKLIEMEVLEEAHLNLLALRLEFQQERARCGKYSPMELSKKEKDLNLLYGELRNKLNAIVRDSNSLPSRNKALLVPVARIIQEEERRAAEPGGLAGSWMEAWREAVGEGVRLKVASVHLERREDSVSWLAVHLGLLGKAIVEDLQSVKRELRWSYPPSFQVFSTYVRSYHRAAGRHVKTLGLKTTELKDLHALLDWIVNRYKSERIMGSPCLQPDMRGESAALQLEDGLLTQLRDKFCCTVKEDMRSSLERVIGLEHEDFWRDSRSPEEEDDLLNAAFHMDIWTMVNGTVKFSGLIDAELKQRVTGCCLLELREFPKRFEEEFQCHCSSLRPKPLWTEYQISYINSFSALQQHMDDYRDACPDQLDGFRQEAARLIGRFSRALEDQFKDDVQPLLRRMMTRKWLTNDEDFDHLRCRTELLTQHCALMRPPHNQHLVGRLHYHVVKEFIGQLMKNNYSCKNRKHEKAARKMRLQWRELSDQFQNMKSTHEWLYAVGGDLSDVLGQKNQEDIKNHLQPLVEHYPDFRKHLVAVLSFRGLLRGRERQLILQSHAQLKKKVGVASDLSRVLFADMPVTVNTDFLSNLPSSCLRRLLPGH